VWLEEKEAGKRVLEGAPAGICWKEPTTSMHVLQLVEVVQISE